MEENEIIIIDNEPEIKSLNDEELLLYKYFKEENKSKIKSNISNEISRLQQIEESSPKIDENKEKLLNEEIQNYFLAKNKNAKISNIIYTIDDLNNEKIIIEKNIKEKKEAKELLNQLKIFTESNNDINNISPDLIQKIKTNNILSKNQAIKKYISKLKLNKNIEQEKLTEEQKLLCSFRNLIKLSYQEAKNNDIMQTTILNLFKELNLDNVDISKLNKENEEDDDKIIDFSCIINITQTFNVLMKELNKYNPYDNINDENKSKLFFKIIFLLLSRYESYSINNDNNDNFFLILVHNNLECLNYLINYYILFYGEQKEIKKEDIEKINNSLINAVIKIKNISVFIFSQVVSKLNVKLADDMGKMKSFDNIGKDTILNDCISKTNQSIKEIFEFFEKLSSKALYREVIYHFNSILTIFFDSLNQKILSENSYSLEDINGLLNVSQEIIKNMKANFEKISSKDMYLGVKFMNNLEQNMEYLKFQELIFILNSNLKQIKNYLISKNNIIYIRKSQFIKLLDSTFNESDKLTELKDIINTVVKEKNNLN